MAKKENDAVDIVFYQKKQEKRALKKAQRKKKTKILLTIIAICAGLYFCWATDISRPKAISVSGTSLLTKEEIIDAANISDNDMMLISNPLKIKRNLLKNPLIDTVNVKWSPFKRVIHINVTEKEVFGYRYVEKNPMLIFMDGEMVAFNDDIYHILPELIYVDKFEGDLQKRLVRSFKDLDKSVLNQITEIHQVKVSFDDKQLQIRMNDGNKVFTSLQSIESLNYYFDILKNLKVNNSCIYIDEMSGKAFSKACPETK